MTDRDDSADLLNRIEHHQLFLIPLDNLREWYRYHHLFADVLNKDLHRFEPAHIPELHRRAAHWHADHDFPVEAVKHALASGDTPLVADLVPIYSLLVYLQGQVHSVLGWFAALGEEVCRGDARLGITRALVVGVQHCDVPDVRELPKPGAALRHGASIRLAGPRSASLPSAAGPIPLWTAATTESSVVAAVQSVGRSTTRPSWSARAGNGVVVAITASSPDRS